MIFDEVLEPRRGVLVRSAASSHLAERDGDLLAFGRDLRRGAELLFSVGEIAAVREHDAEVVAGLPEIGIDLDRLAKKADRPRLHLRISRRGDALDHALYGEWVGRRQSFFDRLRRARLTVAATRHERAGD